MAPTERLGDKKPSNAASLPAAGKGSAKVMVKKNMTKKLPASVAVPAPCPILDMPPEIRNRIYDFCKEYGFCKEDDVGEEYGFTYDKPHPLRKSNKVARWCKPTGRSFFPLTQTCRHIRAEYRPLWLRGSTVTLDFDDVADYLDLFHSLPGTQQLDAHHAPKKIVVLWDHASDISKDSTPLLNLRPLLVLRAFCTWFTVDFESRQLAERDYPHKLCGTCEVCAKCRGRCELVHGKAVSSGDSPADFDECFDEDYAYDSDFLNEILRTSGDCIHDDLFEEVEADIDAEYNYLHALNSFLGNTNKTWLESIRNDRLEHMKIQCTMGVKRESPSIFILFDKGFAPPIFGKKALNFAVCQFLKDVGIIDLKKRSALDFVVGVNTGKVTRHVADRNALIPTYNQCTIHGFNL